MNEFQAVIEMQPTEIINRYVFAVGEHLPRKARKDIEVELKSLLTEMLDARATEEGRPADAAMTASVLREFGEPAEVAQRYVPQRPILSASASANFVTVWKIVAAWVAVFAVGSTALALVNAARDGNTTLEVLASGFGSLLVAMFASLGVVGLIFYLMERADANAMNSTAEKWDPLKLPAAQNPNRVDRTDVIFEVVANTFMFSVLNLTPGWLRWFVADSDGVAAFPLFNEAFFQFVPLFNISLLAHIVLYLYVSTRSSWTRTTRILELFVGITSPIVAWVILNSGVQLAATPAFEPLIRLGITIALIVSAVVVLLNVYRLFTKRWNETDGTSEIELVPNGSH